MNSDWAAANLQTIRTLMERSALYRRALAPTTLLAGILGTLGAVGGYRWATVSASRFVLFWLMVAAFTLGACLLVVRRQALRAGETFWSPPTRRVAQAMLPPLSLGFALGIAMILRPVPEALAATAVFLWIGLYGSALHAAGFFMPRGIRLFGWLLIAISAAGLVGATALSPDDTGLDVAHTIMGGVFGLLHVLYGGYLLATEKRRSAP